MDISIQNKNAAIVLYITGRLDATNSSVLEEKAVELLERNSLKLVINCEKLEYISSSGLRVFLMILKKLGSTGGKLILCTLTESIREVFEISGFDDVFSIFSTEEESLANI
jgi:anti-anti-sigma factor